MGGCRAEPRQGPKLCAEPGGDAFVGMPSRRCERRREADRGAFKCVLIRSGESPAAGITAGTGPRVGRRVAGGPRPDPRPVFEKGLAGCREGRKMKPLHGETRVTCRTVSKYSRGAGTDRLACVNSGPPI